MSRIPLRAIASLLICAAGARATVTYVPIDDLNVIVTGVRSDSSTSDSVVLTAKYNDNYAGLYEGSLAGAATAPNTSWHALLPATINNQSVSSANFYGPNTSLYSPAIGAGNVVAVGSFKFTNSNIGHAMVYEGPLDGTGVWKQIDPATLVPNGQTLLDAIAHSTMGDLVVGNYDTSIITGNAFIYNRVSDSYTYLNPGGTYTSTAYGIWQNGGPTSTHYTIAGGQGPNTAVLDKSYLVDYDSATGLLTHYRTFNYNNTPSGALISHFDGITATATGYNLTGFVTNGLEVKGFLASVRRNADGSFADPVWTDVPYPGATITTGNTVVENNVLGIFLNGGTQSYIATIANYGVSVSATASGARATFTITNNGNTTTGFRITARNDVKSNRPANPAPTPSPDPAPPRFKIGYTLDGITKTKSISTTGATVTLAPDATAKVVERAKATGPLTYKRTIRTTLHATSETDPSITDSAKAKVVLEAE